MTDQEILSRIAAGEDSRTQFKRGPIGVAKFASELTAFANAEGGVILFGVEDDGSIVGLDAPAKKTLNDELSNASNDTVRPAIYPRTEYHTLDGKVILAVIVPEGVSKPYSDKSGNFWTKAGPDKRRITSREELQRLLQKSLLIHADELPVPKTSISDIDLYHLGEFLQANYDIQAEDVLTPGKVDIPQILQNLGFADGSQLTLAGLLLFGKNPQRYTPVNMVKAVAYVGNDMAGSQYRDSDDFGGTLRDMYKLTMQFLSRNLHHVQAGQGFNSLGKLEIPEGALQELVVNMFLHRDYFMSSPWRVMIFDDRVELISPGCLPNHLDIEKIKAGVSVARNPLIFSFATKELPYRGLGTGIKRAIQEGAKMDFISDRDLNQFTAILWRNPTVNSAEDENLPVNLHVNPSEDENLPVNLPVNPSEDENLPVNLPVNPSEDENLHVNRTVNPSEDKNRTVNWTVNPSEGENRTVNWTVNPYEDKNLHVNRTVNPSEGENRTVNWTVNLPDHLEKLLTFLNEHPTATYADMARYLSKKRSIISVYLNQLKNPPYSLIRRVGSDKTGHWEILKGTAQ